MAALELWLDDYSDIYSDFDSRLYTKRRVSEDFVEELKRAFAHRDEFTTDLVLRIPVEKRDQSQEPFITESLYTFFKKRRSAYELMFNKKRAGSWLMLLAGILVMGAGSVVTFTIEHSVISQVLRVILEPGGWFFVWTGMDSLFYDLKGIKKEKKFYTDMATLHWHFRPVEK